MIKSLGLHVLLLFCIISNVANAESPAYNFTIIDHPNAPTANTRLLDVNNNGDAVGYYTDSQNNTFNFIYSGGVYKPLEYLNGLPSKFIISGLNISGRVVGTSIPASGSFEGFIGSDGSYIIIRNDKSNALILSDINDIGQVVGYYRSADGANHGIRLDGQTYVAKPLDNPNASSGGETFATGINNDSHISGFFTDAQSVFHGFIYNGESYKTLDHPNASLLGSPNGTVVNSINDYDQVVGSYVDANGKWHGFVYNGGSFVNIDIANALGTYPRSINNRGEVLGYYVDALGTHGFLASPITTTAISQNGSSISIQTFVGGNLGVNADWWFVAYSPWGHYYSYVYPDQWIDIGTDLSRLSPSYQGQLGNVSDMKLFDVTGIPSGNYILYFGVDTKRDGKLDYDQLHYSSFSLNIP